MAMSAGGRGGGSPAPAPLPYRVPLAYLPRLATTTGLLSLSFGSGGLILLLGLDAWKSFRKKTHWIPGETLLLGALSLQLLSLLNRPIVSISDDQKLTEDSVEQLSHLIHNNQLLLLSGRVVMCVFIGNLLPGVARPRSTSLWSDIVALLISASVALLHISYEVYIVVIKNQIQRHFHPIQTHWDSRAISFLVSNIIIFFSIIFLVLLLLCAALASKSIQDVVAQRIPVVLSYNPRSDSGRVSWATVQEHALKSWIAVRTSQPQYMIARSALSASTGFVVTICVVIFGVESVMSGYKAEKDGFDLLRLMALVLQCAFMALGWTIVCWRWLTAVVYYPRRLKIRQSDVKTYFQVEDFSTRSLVELEEEIRVEGSYLKRFVASSIKASGLHKLLPALLRLQIVVVSISKFCWLISELLFSHECVRRFLMGSHGYREFTRLYQHRVKDVEHSPESDKDIGALMHLPNENPAGVWVANRMSIERIQNRMEEGESKGKGFEQLISLLRFKASRGLSDARNLELFLSSAPKLPVEADFNVGAHSPKMTAVSLSAVMIQLSAYFGVRGLRLAKDAVTACCQAWKMMGVVETSQPESALVNKAADGVFNTLRESNKWLHLQLPMVNRRGCDTSGIHPAREAVRMLAEQGTRMAADNDTPYDSKNWKKVIAGVNLYKVCTAIVSSPSDKLEEFLGEIQSLLADVIVWGVLNMVNVLGGECRRWTERLEEEKVWKAVYQLAVAKGVMAAAECESHNIWYPATAHYPQFVNHASGASGGSRMGSGGGVDRFRLKKSATFSY